MNRNLGFKERRYIEELRILTKSTAIDCIIDDQFDRIIYVIKTGDMGFAIGRKGENIQKMQKVLGKRIEMVEEAGDLMGLINNTLKPAEIEGIERDEQSGRFNILVGKKSDLGIAIGKNGSNIEKARLLAKRFFGVDLGEVVYCGGDHA